MDDLQVKIEDFIIHWQPGNSLILKIPPETPSSEITDAFTSVDYIIDFGIDCGEGFMWFELDSRLMENQYRRHQEQWKRENEFYGRNTEL